MSRKWNSGRIKQWMDAGRNRWTEWGPDNRKSCSVLVGGLLLLTVCGLLGEVRNRDSPLIPMSSVPELSVQEPLFPVSSVQESSVPLSSVQPGADSSRLSASSGPLTEEQDRFLWELELTVAASTVEEAAKVLVRSQETLNQIFQQLDPETILYVQPHQGDQNHQTHMTMAFPAANLCFYGSFRNGSPDGICTAILCQPGAGSGYRYSMGIWKNGKMEGFGLTGTCSWSNGTGEQIKESRIVGVFQQDKLDGNLTYLNRNPSGRLDQWQITAEEGRTSLDGRWSFHKELAEYHLPSESGGNSVFLMPENQILQVWWENLVKWGSRSDGQENDRMKGC
ncbi:MAG: hypothetical protein Q4E86_12715 [Lachnospiraceae bacterium]|nr:hypothetical protein [Lachnospiraceae bacterium]